MGGPHSTVKDEEKSKVPRARRFCLQTLWSSANISSSCVSSMWPDHQLFSAQSPTNQANQFFKISCISFSETYILVVCFCFENSNEWEPHRRLAAQKAVGMDSQAQVEATWFCRMDKAYSLTGRKRGNRLQTRGMWEMKHHERSLCISVFSFQKQGVVIKRVRIGKMWHQVSRRSDHQGKWKGSVEVGDSIQTCCTFFEENPKGPAQLNHNVGLGARHQCFAYFTSQYVTQSGFRKTQLNVNLSSGYEFKVRPVSSSRHLSELSSPNQSRWKVSLTTQEFSRWIQSGGEEQGGQGVQGQIF